jgi:hypothetical protein
MREQLVGSNQPLSLFGWLQAHIGVGRFDPVKLAQVLEHSADPDAKRLAARQLAGTTDHRALNVLARAVCSSDIPLSFAATHALRLSLDSGAVFDGGVAGHIAEGLISFLAQNTGDSVRNQRLNAAELLGICARSVNRAESYVCDTLLVDPKVERDEIQLAAREMVVEPRLRDKLARLAESGRASECARGVLNLLGNGR